MRSRRFLSPQRAAIYSAHTEIPLFENYNGGQSFIYKNQV